MVFRCIATAVFGMEAIVGQEIKSLGFINVAVENGRVLFEIGRASWRERV